MRILALPLVAALAACHPTAEKDDAGDAAAISQAPPLETAPAPAPPAETAPAPPPQKLACPKGMMAVKNEFCIDRYEASLVDKASGMVLSPYYPPDRRLAAQLADTWEKERLEVGSVEARAMPLPKLPAWQRTRDVEPVAVSKAGVVPNGYLSGVMAERACKNAEKRLCRYDEWVTACKGAANRQYPYGAEYKQGACNVFRWTHPAAELHDNATIGHLDPRLNLVKEKSGDPLLRKTGGTPECKSEWEGDAAWDMNGNLDEWVEDEKGKFAGGFYARSNKAGCDAKITAHVKAYQDYSTGTRCCWSPDGSGVVPGG